MFPTEMVYVELVLLNLYVFVILLMVHTQHSSQGLLLALCLGATPGSVRATLQSQGSDPVSCRQSMQLRLSSLLDLMLKCQLEISIKWSQS